MTPPSLGRIHSDDRALDALGGRRRPAERDELSDLLSAWVGEIDRTPARSRRARRAAGTCRTSVRPRASPSPPSRSRRWLPR
ncbi:hypothetical protein [Barrientosiimonas endolithica]|uniref:hypothetical protein n=1 Tax=Barrientosiimonas endolithica TaxID=1535208 RepID=UPI00259BCF4A|nr:hypothetical protein [Barrientosiimonas endolithica]